MPVLRDLPSEDGIELTGDATSTTHDKASQKSVPLHRTSSQSKQPSYESTGLLVEAVDADKHRHLPRSAVRKPFFLHQSMWLWEVVSVIFATLIFVIIITVLTVYNEKPSSVIGGVTLNTAIAFAATLFRMSLMVPVTGCMCQLTWVSLQKGYQPLRDVVRFDMASRGPLGSLQLLLNFKSFNLMASIAAILVMISIIIGSFFQQSIDSYTKSIPQEFADATIRRAFASTAFTYSGSVGDVGPNVVLYGKDAPFNLKTAAYSGLYSAGMTSLPYPPYSCPTGNCTWDPFPTLGVSAQCFDDAAAYSFNCSETNRDDWPGHPFTPCSIASVSTRASALPTLHAPVPGNIISSTILFASNVTYTPWSPIRWFGSNYSIEKELPEAWQDNSSSIQAGFAMFEWKLARNPLYLPPGQLAPGIITPESTIEAGYCIFYTDMQIINARVENGVYEEHVLNTTIRTQGIVDSLAGREGNFTYTYNPECQSSAVQANCDLAPIDITFPRARYQTITAFLTYLLPSATATTGLLAGMASSGETNPGAAEYL